MRFRGTFIQEIPSRMRRVCISFPYPSAKKGAGGKGDFDIPLPAQGAHRCDGSGQSAAGAPLETGLIQCYNRSSPGAEAVFRAESRESGIV